MMKRSKIISYVYDFLKIMFDRKEFEDKIRKIILFGSVVRGNFDEKSDIDIFIDVKNKPDVNFINKRLPDVISEFEMEAKETWDLEGIKFPLKCIVGNLEDKTWRDLKRELGINGIVLYGKYEFLPKNVKHSSMFKYSLTNLNKKNKMKFIRNLFGYKTKKGNKIYKHKGMLDHIGGKKISRNLILVPVEESLKLQKFFNSFKISPKIKEVWIEF